MLQDKNSDGLVIGHVELPEESREERHFESLLARIREDLGFDHVNFGVIDPGTGDAKAFSTYSEGWRKHYMENGYSRIDPSATVVSRRIAPIDWELLQNVEGYDEVFSAACDFGVPQQGLTIPVRGVLGEVGLLSVSSNMARRDWKNLTRDRIVALQQRAAALTDEVCETLSPITKHVRPQISKKEKEILQYLSAGRDVDDIAKRMNISYNLVEIYLKSAQTKLRALSVPQAVGRALQYRIISLA
jgi:DNA-binding CsgD family transcriptional regulator